MPAALVCQLQTETRMQTPSARCRVTKKRFARRHDALDCFVGAAVVILLARVGPWIEKAQKTPIYLLVPKRPAHPAGCRCA
jgi:hypothetical protein